MTESLVNAKDHYAAKKLKTLAYRDASYAGTLADALKDKKVRFVEADFSEPGGDCEDCEGYGVWLVLAIDDKGQVVGVEQGFAACPFAYLMTDAGPVLQGELLRNLSPSVRESTQGLAVQLPRCSGQVTFRIAEEKRELTRLDELVLVIDGEPILPDTCGALCANDGRSHVLAQGESLDVTFTLPAGARCEHVMLRANGYYDPQPR